MLGSDDAVFPAVRALQVSAAIVVDAGAAVGAGASQAPSCVPADGGPWVSCRLEAAATRRGDTEAIERNATRTASALIPFQRLARNARHVLDSRGGNDA